MNAVIELKLPVVIKKKGKIVVACCPAFDVWTQGDSIDKAKKNITEALKLFLLTCFEKGTFEKVLKDCGFVLRNCGFTPQKKFVNLPSGHEFIKVPLDFDAKNCHPAVCHA